MTPTRPDPTSEIGGGSEDGSSDDAGDGGRSRVGFQSQPKAKVASAAATRQARRKSVSEKLTEE
eukprot:7785873-Alexandrium_andersonii.AAC.1